MKIWFYFFILLPTLLISQHTSSYKVLAQTMLRGEDRGIFDKSNKDKIGITQALLAELDFENTQGRSKYWQYTSEEAQFAVQARYYEYPEYIKSYYLSHNMTIFYLIEAIRLSNYEFENEIDMVSVYKDSLGGAYYVPVGKDSSFFRELEGYYRRYLDTVSVSTFALSAESCEASPLYPSAYRWYSPKIALAMKAQAQPIVSRISKDLRARNMRSIELAGASPFYIISKYGSRDMPLYFGSPCF